MRLRWMLTGLLALAMVMAISPALAQDAAEEETAVDPDVQAVTDALTAVIDSVTSFDEDAIKAAFSERSVVVLSFMGVRVLDRAGLIDFVRYENVSQAEFGEVEVTMVDGLAFVQRDDGLLPVGARLSMATFWPMVEVASQLVATKIEVN